MDTRLHCPVTILETYIYDNHAEELKQRLRAIKQAKSHVNEAKIKAKMYADKVLIQKSSK